MVRILIVDDHELVRIGLRHILDKQPGLKVVGEADSGESALRAQRELSPDVILLDVSLPGLSGFEVTRRIRRVAPEVRIIILTVHAESPYPARLLESGASAYLTKGCAADELVAAVHKTMAGERYVGNDIAQQLALALLPGADPSPFEVLTAREMEVLLMLVQGEPLARIGEILSLSPKTVSTYKYRIYDKLAIRGEIELMRLALRHGIIEPARETVRGGVCSTDGSG